MEIDIRKKQLQKIKLEIENLRKLKKCNLIDSDSYFEKLLSCREQLVKLIKDIDEGIGANNGPILLHMFSKN